MSIKDTAPSLEQWYTIRDARVKPFIEQHPFLLPIVLEAYAKIRAYFPDLPLALKVYADHEMPDWKTLNVVVGINTLSEEKVDQAIAQMDRLYDDWWLDEVSRAHQKMTVMLGSI